MSNKFLSNISKVIIILAIISGLVFTFSVFSNANNTEDSITRNDEEVTYLDTKLLSLINYLNNIDLQNYKVVLTKVESAENSSSNENSEQDQKNKDQEDSTESGTDAKETVLSKMEQETIIEENTEINWNAIEGELEILCSTWPSIVLDLYNLEIDSEKILEFSTNLDEAIINVKKQDKALSCMYLAKLYSFLPEFLDKTQGDEIKLRILETKTYIINAYAFAETKNWTKMGEEIAKGENILTSLVNDVRIVDDTRKYNINKAYILVEELKKSLSTQDTEIFYVKYKNLLEQLNIID